jgi:hypothetical protein
VNGQPVANILNDESIAGMHEVVFNAATLPSGIYFMRLCAGQHIETAKLLLLK